MPQVGLQWFWGSATTNPSTWVSDGLTTGSSKWYSGVSVTSLYGANQVEDGVAVIRLYASLPCVQAAKPSPETTSTRTSSRRGDRR